MDQEKPTLPLDGLNRDVCTDSDNENHNIFSTKLENEALSMNVSPIDKENTETMMTTVTTSSTTTNLESLSSEYTLIGGEHSLHLKFETGEETVTQSTTLRSTAEPSERGSPIELLNSEIEFSDDDGAWTNADDNQTQESTERVSSSSDVDEMSSEKNVETQESFQVSESSSEMQLKGPELVSKRKKINRASIVWKVSEDTHPNTSSISTDIGKNTARYRKGVGKRIVEKSSNVNNEELPLL